MMANCRGKVNINPRRSRFYYAAQPKAPLGTAQ
jgi:hypothetical protein